MTRTPRKAALACGSITKYNGITETNRSAGFAVKRSTHRRTPEIMSADPIFSRLCLDIIMARRVKADTVAREALAEAEARERGAWTAMAQYTSAVAWADPHERIRSGQRRRTRRKTP